MNSSYMSGLQHCGAPPSIPPGTSAAPAVLRSHRLGSAAPCSAKLFQTWIVPLCRPLCSLCGVGLPQPAARLHRPCMGLPLWDLGSCCPQEYDSVQGLPQKHGPLWAESAEPGFLTQRMDLTPGTNQGPLTGVGEATGTSCLLAPEVAGRPHGIYTSICSVRSWALQNLCSAGLVGFANAGVPGQWL